MYRLFLQKWTVRVYLNFYWSSPLRWHQFKGSENNIKGSENNYIHDDSKTAVTELIHSLTTRDIEIQDFYNILLMKFCTHYPQSKWCNDYIETDLDNWHNIFLQVILYRRDIFKNDGQLNFYYDYYFYTTS